MNCTPSYPHPHVVSSTLNLGWLCDAVWPRWKGYCANSGPKSSETMEACETCELCFGNLSAPFKKFSHLAAAGKTTWGRHRARRDLTLHGESKRSCHSSPAHGLQLPPIPVKGPDMCMKPLLYCTPIHSLVSDLWAINLYPCPPMESWKAIKRSYQATMLADHQIRTQQAIISCGIKHQWEDGYPSLTQQMQKCQSASWTGAQRLDGQAGCNSRCPAGLDIPTLVVNPAHSSTLHNAHPINPTLLIKRDEASNKCDSGTSIHTWARQ